MINPVKPTGELYVPPGLTLKTLNSAHTVYLCVLYESYNKQCPFSYTALASGIV